MNRFKAGMCSLMMLSAAVVRAGSATIELASFPTMSVADGRSTVTVSATIRDIDGKLVPDGTRVVFSCDRGTFRETVVNTQNGVARAILQAGTVAGVSKITASAITYQATATVDYEFVGDRSLLSSAKEYVEMDAPNDLRYSMDLKVLEASGADQSAVMQYRDIEIRADDIQLNVPTYEVRAKNAILKIGNEEIKCGQLYFRLAQRMGFGTTNYKYKPREIQPFGDGVRFIEGEERETYGIAEIRPGSIKLPDNPVQGKLFEMVDIGDSATLIAAKKAIAYPRKEIQFQKADVYMGGARVMRLPLFKVSMYNSSPLLTDQMIKINDNQLAIDYPYYLSLKPGQTSLLRFSMGRNGGRGLAANRGVFLDYEYQWNHGDDMQGSAALTSLGRSDWGATMQQYFKLDQQTDLMAQLDIPAHRAVFANLNFSHQFPGMSLSANATHNQAISGTAYNNQQMMINLDKDPIKVGNSPFRIRYGFGASQTMAGGGGFSSSQQVFGAHMNATMNPVYFGKETSLTGSATLSKLQGTNTNSGLSINTDLTLSQSFRGGGFALGYDFIDDGFTSNFLGQHQLTARLNYFLGNSALNFFMIKSLDVDRISMQIDASYRFARDWRLSYAYTYDRFLTDSFLDYNLILGYRIGYREVGLTWSYRTKRLGFQVLGTTYN
jgi:hypothetical protein